MPSVKRSRHIAILPLPNLLTHNNQTRSSMLHKISFVVPLMSRIGCITSVKDAYDIQQWSDRTIQMGAQARNLIDKKAFVGDEAGVILYSSKLLDRSLVQYSRPDQSIRPAAQGDFKSTGF